MTSPMFVSLIFILYSYAPIRKQYLWGGGGGFPNIMNIYYKPSCDIIIICFPDKTIFIMLSGPEVFNWFSCSSYQKQGSPSTIIYCC